MPNKKLSYTDRLKLIYDYYGERPDDKRCKNCCNLWEDDRIEEGEPPRYYCIAYGQVSELKQGWNAYAHACGLYNRPFRGLRPSRRPLVEIKESPTSDTDFGDMQMALL